MIELPSKRWYRIRNPSGRQAGSAMCPLRDRRRRPRPLGRTRYRLPRRVKAIWLLRGDQSGVAAPRAVTRRTPEPSAFITYRLRERRKAIRLVVDHEGW